jgi:hypothetical protein
VEPINYPTAIHRLILNVKLLNLLLLEQFLLTQSLFKIELRFGAYSIRYRDCERTKAIHNSRLAII